MKKARKHLVFRAFSVAEKERFELSRRVLWQPTPLAGAPLRPLEYFSVSLSDADRLRNIRLIIISYSPGFVKGFVVFSL